VNARFARRLVALAGRRRRAAAVDLGTGPADIPLRVARLRPGWRIVAVDASAPMLRTARAAVRRARLGRAVRLLRADACATGLPDASADVVFSNSLLHHLHDPAPFWREVARIAKPGAAILVRDLRRPETRARARRIVARYAAGEPALLRNAFFHSLLAAFTPAEIRAQLRRAGLTGLRLTRPSDRHVDIYGRLGAARRSPRY
jgi:ubiquinone/menaquinone biosynthesis C-methylase UbiE